MARTLQQILAQLAPAYNPQIKTVKERQALIPGQIQAEEQGLQAKQGEAFGSILSGARQRGLGFSGIPLAEQAKYTSTEYLPALARLRQSGREEALSLQDALSQIYERRNSLAQQLRQSSLDRAMEKRRLAEEKRQFNLNYQLAKRQSSGSGSGGGGFSPSLGGFLGGGGGGGKSGAKGKVPSSLQNLYNQVFIRPDGSEWGYDDIVRDYNATLKSAQYGNARDIKKIKLYHSVKPDIFGRELPRSLNKIANSRQVKF